jgi:hypothetical protein
MAISEEIIRQLTPQLRGVAFPQNFDASPVSFVQEVGSFNINAPETAAVASRCQWKAKADDIANLGDPTVIQCELIAATTLDPNVSREIVNNQILELGGFYGFDSFPNVTYKFKNTDYRPSTLNSPPDLSSPIIPGEAPPEAIISGSGLPLPFDHPYFNSLFEIKIDPIDNLDVFYIVDFVVEFDYFQIAFEFVDEILLETGDAILRDSNNDSPSGRIVRESSLRGTDVPIITTLDSPHDPDLDGIVNYDLYVEGGRAYRKDRFTFNQTVRNWTGERIGDLLRTAIESSKYKELNYVQHYMYHPTTGEAFYASTYAQHVAYANLGYVHSYPQQ